MTASTGPVVIGVNGSPTDESALRLGVSESRRLGVGVSLAHVVPDYVAISPMMPVTPRDFAEIGGQVLRGALKELREIHPDLEADSQLLRGPRAKRLAEAAEGASLLVVGRDDRPLLERLVLGNTATGVAATATCPVLSVPAGWQPEPARGVVLVGVKSPTHATELLGDAFAVAAARGARLVVLHSWRLPSGYDDIIEARVDLDDWTRRATDEMDLLTEEWRRTYPDVEVETRIVHGRPVTALVEASADADVLVIVRRSRGIPAAVHLGGTARALLRTAECPVRVVPPRVVVDAVPGLVLEQAGSLSR